jgi:annexin A7/11
MLKSDQYEKDAEVLRKAMKGWGTDEKPIIELTAKRNNADRQEIIKFYKSSFGRDLIKDFEDELGGNLKRAVVGMFKTHIDYDCYELYYAMKGAGTTDSTLIEIIGTRDVETLKEIQTRFKFLYKDSLEYWIKDETSGDFKRMLISLLACGRSNNKDLNSEKLQKDVKDLYDAGEGKSGTDEEVFNKILSLRSPDELRYICRQYEKTCCKKLYDVIKSEFSGNICRLLKTIVLSTCDPVEYYSSRIYKACKGMGTDDKTLIRCLISRDEIDLKLIKEFYPKKYTMTLYEQIKDECSGDYKDMLLAIAQNDHC